MKKNMLFLIGCMIAFASCKKSTDGASNTLMIAEVYNNGHLDADYIYTSDQRLIRSNEYGIQGNQSKLSLYVLYEYSTNGILKKRKIFTPNDTLNNHYELSHDNVNRLTRMDWYFAGTVFNYRLFDYDQQGNMIKHSTKDADDNATDGYTEFTYDDQGRLLTQKVYVLDDDKFKIGSEIIFTPGGKNVYKHWKNFMTSPTEFFMNDLLAESRHHIIYALNGNVNTDYTETGSNREFNGAGYLVSQTITRVYAKPVKANEVRNMQYVYTH